MSSSPPNQAYTAFRGMFSQSAVSIMAAVFVSVFLATYLLVRSQQNRDLAQQSAKAQLMAQVVSSPGATAVDWKDVSGVLKRLMAAYPQEEGLAAYLVVTPVTGEGLESLIYTGPDHWETKTLDPWWGAQRNDDQQVIDSPLSQSVKGKVLHYTQHLLGTGGPEAHFHIGIRLANPWSLTLWGLPLSSALLTGSALALLSALYLAKRVTNSVESLRQLTQQLHDGEFTARADVVQGVHEIENLTLEMNEMAASLEDRWSAQLETHEPPTGDEPSHAQAVTPRNKDAELKERARAGFVVGEISRDFFKCTPEKLPEAISHALARLGNLLELSTASIHTPTPDGRQMRREWMWNMPPDHNGSALVPMEDFPASPIGIVATIPPQDEFEANPVAEKWLKLRKAESGAVVALRSGSAALGYLVLQSREAREWSSTSLQVIHATANTFASVIERMRGTEERNQRQDLQMQAQKMKAVSSISGNLAHDFNNMLVPILGYSDALINTAPEGAHWVSEVREIKRAAEAAANLTRQLLSFSRKQIIFRRKIQLNDLLRENQEKLRNVLAADLHLELQLEPTLWTTFADPAQLHQCFYNLCSNASIAMRGQAGRITLSTSMIDSADTDFHQPLEPVEGYYVRITITDTGCGMDAATQRQIFDPFFTTREADATGLGLSVVHGIITQHSGHLHVISAPGAGTTIHLYLPAHEAPDDSAVPQVFAKESTAAIPRARGQRILLIEDEPAVLAFVTSALQQHGYELISADSAAKARQLFAEHGHSVQLVMSDIVLPDGTGLELLDEFFAAQPELRALLTSGYSEKGALMDMVERRGVRFLHKPYSLAQLLEATQAAIEGWPVDTAAE